MKARAAFFACLAALAVAALAVQSFESMTGTAEAAPNRTRPGSTLDPGFRAVPPPRVLPAPKVPRVTPVPNPALVPRFGPGPGITRPNTYGPNCRSSCGSRCQMISCAGLNVSQCLSVRQQCRTSCSSRCI